MTCPRRRTRTVASPHRFHPGMDCRFGPGGRGAGGLRVAVPPPVAACWLGRCDAAFTQRTYVHASETHLLEQGRRALARVMLMRLGRATAGAISV